MSSKDYISTAPLAGEYLEHWRTKGSKNGVRLYQHEDGTYTELGKERRRVSFPKFKKPSKEAVNRWFDPSIKGGKDRPPVSPAERIMKETGNTAERTANIAKTLRPAKPRPETKKMSDEELRKRIQRLELEKRYNTLVDEDISRGKVALNDILSVVGDVAAIGVSGAIIYSTIREMTKKE